MLIFLICLYQNTIIQKLHIDTILNQDTYEFKENIFSKLTCIIMKNYRKYKILKKIFDFRHFFLTFFPILFINDHE